VSTTDTPLLPDADPLSGGSLDDALGLLYSAMAQQSQSSMQVGEATVKIDEQAEKNALADQQAAAAREQANQANHGRGFFSSLGHLAGDVTKDAVHLKPGALVKDTASDVKDAANSPAFWNDLEKGALVVAKGAAIVGSAVVTAASFGSGAATIAGAAILLSVSGDVIDETHCFGKASEGIAIGCDVLGVAAGASSVAVGALDTGLNATSKTALGVGAALNGVGGGSEVVAGGAHIENQAFAAAAENAAADMQHAVNQNAELTQTVGDVIDDLKASDQSHQGALQATQGAIQANDQSTAAAVANISVKG
jgi:hypothetical protein